VELRERKENRTRGIMPVVLPDGSLIRMMPEAVVQYSKRFSDNRDVYLEGEAEFEVTTDKDHSFTVYSREVSTEVLGTYFRVKAVSGEDTITVRLNTGKVLVHARSEAITLSPGQELRYSRSAMKAIVRNFNTVVKHIGLVKAGSEGNKGAVRPDWYKFSNQPMKAVLDQLSDYYGVAIYYSPSDIATLYFDGKFEKKDSLEKILMDITLPNDLRFVREDSGYIIRKR
jgi:ferric-dicitrate binding protein FerR (iron transport regulator)